MINKIKRLAENETAATTVEYAVMLMLVVGACIVAIQSVASVSSDIWNLNGEELDQVFKD